MLKLAITGNIASGKSEVEKILVSLGYKVLDTDKVAHDLLYLAENAFRGYDIYENGSISRKKMGKLVFSNPKLKEKLENILYPNIKIKINEFFEKNKNEKFVFVSIPQLFESGMQNLFDKIISIYCDDDIRLSRLVKRNNYSVEYAKLRIEKWRS